jgi:Tol biopolymer transport system component
VKKPASRRNKKRKRRPIRLVLAFFIFLLFGFIAGGIYIRPGLPGEIYAALLTPRVVVTATVPVAVLPPTETPTSTSTTTQVPATATQTVEPTVTFTPTLTPVDTKTPTPTVTPLGGGFGQIAFVSNRTGTMQIWMMNSDGGNQHQITNVPEGACQPAWSPDGQKLAYISPCARKNNEHYPGANIYIIELDDPTPTLLPVSSEQGDFDPAWSPVGNRIAFTSLRMNAAHVFVYNFDDESLHEISDTRFADIHPAWNPEGTQLAVARKNVYNHIFILSDKGFTQYQLSSNGNVEDYWPAWSSDGKSVIYSRSTLDPSLPYLLTIDEEDHGTAVEVRIPPPGNTDISPIAGAEYSQDGQYIIFESWPDGRNHDIYIMNNLGQNPLRLTTDPAFEFDPTWRPIKN